MASGRGRRLGELGLSRWHGQANRAEDALEDLVGLIWEGSSPEAEIERQACAVADEARLLVEMLKRKDVRVFCLPRCRVEIRHRCGRLRELVRRLPVMDDEPGNKVRLARRYILENVRGFERMAEAGGQLHRAARLYEQCRGRRCDDDERGAAVRAMAGIHEGLRRRCWRLGGLGRYVAELAGFLRKEQAGLHAQAVS